MGSHGVLHMDPPEMAYHMCYCSLVPAVGQVLLAHEVAMPLVAWHLVAMLLVVWH